MTILQKIVNNKICLLRITMEAEDVFHNEGSVHDFLDALQANTSINEVHLDGDFLCCLRASTRGKVLQSIGDYLGSSVHEITIGDSLVTVLDLTHMIMKSKSLIRLNLHDLVLQGQEEEFRAFELAVLQHPTLKDFRMCDKCYTAIPEIDLDKVKHAKNGVYKPMGEPIMKVSAIAKSA
jgi:hypothetical protein